ncbi:hypothetical protein [Burkholderia vietnamiensis]|uniref:hypothetical protein n=1 Tax=Burkholderia vietnamiensis TaxID=60552 RepID=UPI001592BE88|nr:hypothetical protein [Burkholderia vietnamiensis]
MGAEVMEGWDIIALALLISAISDVAIMALPSTRKDGVEWGLRLICGATLGIIAFLFFQREFEVGFLATLCILGGACQAALMWRTYRSYRRANAESDKQK